MVSPAFDHIAFYDNCKNNMPCGTFLANAVYFGIGIISYNLFAGFKLLNPEFLKHTIKTFRWSFLNIAGKIIKAFLQYYPENKNRFR